MNQVRSFFIILFLCLLSLKINAQSIIVDGQKTPQELVENILINSSCLSVSNISGNGDPGIFNHTYAYFNAGTSDFSFPEGIVLSTSTGMNIAGPYTSSMGGGNPLSWFGDTDLDQTLGIHSTNATSLEFDFVALTNFINFNYIFASNEYQFDFACSYSDGFAFLIKEAGTTDPYTNIAVIPDTNTPVSSISIHPTIVPGRSRNGDAYSGCPESNPKYFDRLRPAVTTSIPANDAINFAGQTVTMNAKANVTVGKKYHIKLVIGDDRNQYYDSAVFLQAGSFTTQIDLGPDQTAANNDPVCFGETVTLNTNLSSAYSYKWFRDNIEITDANSPSFAATETGTYKVEVLLTPSTCAVMGQIKLEFAPEILFTNTNLLQCDDDTDGISIFDLNKVNNIVKNNISTTINEGYYETLADAEAKTNKITTPNHYTNKTANQIVYARLENQYGCFKVTQVTLQIATTAIPNPNPVATCDADAVQDGLYHFDLNAEVTPQITSGLPSGLTAVYFLTASDALTETNPLSNIFNNTTAYNQTIYARVVNGPDCYDVVPVNLVVNTFNPSNFEDEEVIVCKGDQVTLTVATGFSSYLWNTGDTTNFIRITNAGDYSVTVTDVNGCEKTKKFKAIASEAAIITEVVVKDFSGTDNSVLIKYTGTGDYEFSLDGSVFQDDPLFNGVKSGIYYAVARDKNGCGLSNRFIVYVLDYPKFFTPNGDGYNDLWTIEVFDQLPDYKIFIYDRYGKFLKQMNQNSPGWNGIFNGQQLPADDYWFNLIFENGKNIKGHFSLKR